MASFKILEPTSTIVSSNGTPPRKAYNLNIFVPAAGYIDLEILGGYHADGGDHIPIKFTVNTTNLGVYTVNRWTDHAVIIPDRRLITIPASALRLNLGGLGDLFPGSPLVPNKLTIEATSGLSGDYFFIGPLVYHTD